MTVLRPLTSSMHSPGSQYFQLRLQDSKGQWLIINRLALNICRRPNPPNHTHIHLESVISKHFIDILWINPHGSPGVYPHYFTDRIGEVTYLKLHSNSLAENRGNLTPTPLTTRQHFLLGTPMGGNSGISRHLNVKGRDTHCCYGN